MHVATFRNTILHISWSLTQSGDLLFHPVVFEIGHEIEFPGSPIANIVFVEEGMASMTTTFEDGSQVEVGMFGFESVIGVSALMGTKLSLNRIYTQVEGRGFNSPLEAARREFQRGGSFQELAQRYVQVQLVQTLQSAGCAAKHHLEQRLARWLLITADRVQRTSFKMSQEYLADMVGATRSMISRTASVLKDEGLIDYVRGTIHILDQSGLERRSCECYAVIKRHLDNYAEFDHGSAERHSAEQKTDATPATCCACGTTRMLPEL